MAVTLVMLQAIYANAEKEENALERHERAIDDIGQYVENMKDRWFAATTTRTYFGSDGKPYTLERLSVIYRSESMLYINSQQLMTSPQRDRTPIGHVELIGTDAWTIMINHHPRGPNRPLMKIAAANTPASRLIEYSVRTESDITLRFETRIQQNATHEYSSPRLDKDGRLVVRLDRRSYVNDSDPARMRQYPVLEVTFSGRSGTRPVMLQSFLENENGDWVQTAQSDVHYTMNKDGQPVLQSQQFKSTHLDKPNSSWDFRVRETSRPKWIDWPPRISIPAGTLDVQQYSDTGTASERVGDLPAQTTPLIQHYDEAELKTRLQQQLDTLQTVQDYVMAVPLNTVERVSSASETSDAPDAKTTNTVPLVLGCLACSVFVCWLVVWFRWHSAKL